MSLDSEGSKPLYMQLYDTLKSEIENGVYKKGERIPTELELSQKYGISRITVRNALEKLTRDNYLVRHRGRGTFVCGEKYQRSIAENLSFTDMCRQLHCEPGAKTIKSVIENATRDDIAELGIPEDSKIIALERIRYMDGVPVSLESGRYTEDYAFLIDEDLNNCSLYQLLREKYGVVFGQCSRAIEIVFSSFQLSKYLNVPIGYPLLSMHGVIYDSKGAPAYRNQQFIVGDKFTLTL